MKNNYLLKSFICVAVIVFSYLNTNAQVTLDAVTNLPEIGDEYQLHRATLTSLDPGDAGENITWDFSSLPAADRSFTITVSDPSSHSNSADFPDADIVILNNYFGPRSATLEDKHSHFYRADGGQLVKLGRVDDYSSPTTPNMVVNVFNDEEIQYNYPIAYNDMHSDTYDGSYTLIFNFDWSDASNQYRADGYGTLKLAGRTIENVLRIRRQRDYTETSIVATNEWGHLVYEWYTPGIPFPLLSLNHFTVNGGSDEYLAFIMDDSHLATVGINNVGHKDVDFNIYPNPSKDILSLTYELKSPANTKISIGDISGRILEVLENQSELKGTYNKTYALNNLENGMYLVTLQIDNVSHSKIISVQH